MWKKWKEEHPTPGEFVYVRDLDKPEDWEIGWVVGVDGDTRVMLPGDPSYGKHIMDEWQYVQGPC